MKYHLPQLIIVSLILFPSVQPQTDNVFENNIIFDVYNALFPSVQPQTDNVFENNIIFYVYNATGYQFNSTCSNNATLLEACNGADNVTIIAHGWGESIDSVWTKAMIGNFTISRGGCVFFMDYSFYSKADYTALYLNFNPITQVLTRKLFQLDQLGFNPNNSFIFSFSFGSHVVFEAAYQYGPRKIGRIDACDPAGPYFVPRLASSTIHANDSAQFVQCIHTSNDLGTYGRYCQRDINMGRCGNNQPGATVPPYLSHGLCPHMYNNAFKVDFNMVTTATIFQYLYSLCFPVQTLVPDVTQLPNCTMGYRFNTNFPYGEYWALTGVNYPWNTV